MSTVPPQTPRPSGHELAETSGVIPALPGSDDDPGSGLAVRSLFTGLVDDAAVFPPGLAPLEAAVPGHLEHHRSWYSDVIGPFLFPARSVDGFENAVRALPAGSHLRVGVVADAASDDPLTGALEALRRATALDGVEPVAVEVPLPRGTDQARAAGDLVPRLQAALPRGLQAWVEVQREAGWDQALATIASAGDDIGAKMRTGGTEAQAFPGADELAAFLRRAVDVDAAFKLTAGLHTAVRGPDATGAEHHGLLNVVGAVRAALNGAETPEVADVLRETSAARLASAARRMSDADASVLRAFFVSFGCCGVTDPVGELVDLGLLQEVPA